MANSTHLQLPLLAAAQAQKHVTHNDAVYRLDAMVQLSVKDRDLTAPPGAPADGDRYIPASGATGAWATWDLNVAWFSGGVWTKLVPREGWAVWVADEDLLLIWDGAAWVNVIEQPTIQTGTTDWKDSVRAATTANITLSGEQTVDTIALTEANNDSILVWKQTAPAENGIWDVKAAAWTRRADADTNAEVTSGIHVFVEGGATNGSKIFKLTTADPIVVGTTGLTFEKTEVATSFFIPKKVAADNYTLTLDDPGKMLWGAGTGVKTWTVPTNGSVPIPIGSEIMVQWDGSATNALSLVAQGGVVIDAPFGLTLPAQGSWGLLKKRQANRWSFQVPPSKTTHITNDSGVAGSVARLLSSRLSDIVSVKDFGVVGDGTTDDSAAFAAAWAYVSSLPRGSLYIPANTVVTLTDEQNVYVSQVAGNSNRISIFGEGDCSVIQANFTGAGKALLNATHPTTPTTRGDGPRLSGLLLKCKDGLSGIGPVLFKQLNATNPQLDHVTFIHRNNNSSILLSNVYNGSLNNIICWNGGYCVPYRRITWGAITITTTADSRNVSASAAAFEAGDAGKYILIHNANQTLSMIAKIETFTDTQNIVLDRPVLVSKTDAKIYFDAVRGTIGASSTALTLNANVLSASDVGRYLVVAGGSYNHTTGARHMLHAQITAVPAANQATLSKASGANALTDVPVFFSPDIHIVSDPGTDLTNDLRINNLHTELWKGCGLAVGYGVKVVLTGKIHARNMEAQNVGTEDFSLTPLLWEASGSKLQHLMIDGSPASPHRAIVGGIISSAKLDYIGGQLSEWQKVVHLQDCATTARVRVVDLQPSQNKSANSMADLISTDGTVRAEHPGARSELRDVCRIDDDFLGGTLSGIWSGRRGSDAQTVAPFIITGARNGVVRMTFGDDAAATMAVNGAQLESKALEWQAITGEFLFEARIKMSATTNIAVFLGLTDQNAALEMPFTLGAGDALTSNASNAVGVLFDTAADTDNWWLVGVKADVDATKQNTALAPVAGTYETWTVRLTTDGEAVFFRNGKQIGIQMAAAVTSNTLLTPVVAGFSRTTATRNVDVDWIVVESLRL